MPSDVDSTLAVLVQALLDKDHKVRPSVFQLVKYPALKQEIIEFTEKNGVQQEMTEIWDYIIPNEEQE